jgi:hypothetical protein
MQAHPRISLGILFGVVAVLMGVAVTLALVLGRPFAADVESPPEPSQYLRQKASLRTSCRQRSR